MPQTSNFIAPPIGPDHFLDALPRGIDAADAAEPPAASAADTPSADAPERVVNLALCPFGGDTAVPRTTNIVQHRRYRLRVDIGPPAADSVVDRPEPFPLAPPPEGHWLEVVACGEGWDVSPASPGRGDAVNLFLPQNGASWVCTCRPGVAHSCAVETRQRHAWFLATPLVTGNHRLSVVFYSNGSVVQMLELVAVVDAEAPTLPAREQSHWARVKSAATRQFDNLAELPASAVSLLAYQAPQEDGAGAPILVVNGQSFDAHGLTLREAQLTPALGELRATLAALHRQRTDDGDVNLLDARNGKDLDAFKADLQRLAVAGRALWASLFDGRPALWDSIAGALEQSSGGVIQGPRAAATPLSIPWALVYDIPIETGIGAVHRFCELLDAWDARSGALPMAAVTACLGRRHAPGTLCPAGFWGYRHVIEQPPSTPEPRDLCLTVRADEKPPVLKAMFGQGLDAALAQAHQDALQALGGGKLALDVIDKGRAVMLKALCDLPLAIVYFYCHGGRAGVRPSLVLSPTEAVTPEDIGLHLSGPAAREAWQRVNPFVFLNGCHTAELAPTDLLNFVDAFVTGHAAGVLGTEIVMHQRLANEAALEVLRRIAADIPVGEAVREMRLGLLAKGNLLGLAYTPWCSARLKLAG